MEVWRQLIHTEGWEAFKERAINFFTDFAQWVQRLEKDLGNMRKARGGRTFELAVAELLKRNGIPCELPTRKASQQLGQIDLVVPDVETSLRSPDSAVFLALKRTLRERWKQEVPILGEGRLGW